MSPRAIRVAVIGAGMGGLTAALTLDRLGVDVRVFDRARELRALGGGLALRPPAAKALEYLGIEPLEVGAPSQPRYARKDGRILATFPALPADERMAGFPLYLGALRSGLYATMLERLPAERIDVGKRAVSVEQDEHSATVHFDDGTEYSADIVIGADGINSLVRTVFEPVQPPREHNVIAWIGHTFYDGIPDRSETRLTLDPSGYQISYSPIVHHGRPGWHWWALESWNPAVAPATGADALAHVREITAGMPAPFPSLLEHTDAGDIIPWIIRDRPPLTQWTDGRIVLIGDAAHPTSPYSGYGAGMAIIDGFTLGSMIARAGELTTRDQIASVLTAFQNERKASADAVVQFAYVMGQQMHHADARQALERDDRLDNTAMLQDRVDAQFGAPLVAEYLRVHELGEQLFRHTAGDL
jgi:2-polyprenyl-6-methoxyphenol hydroxylase-like FAD-dependent oxidoreductase